MVLFTSEFVARQLLCSTRWLVTKTVKLINILIKNNLVPTILKPGALWRATVQNTQRLYD